MESVYHIPAMLEETLQGLLTDREGIYVDVTLGGGGHSRAILERLGANGRLYSFDQDREAIANALEDKGVRMGGDGQETSAGEDVCAPGQTMVRPGDRTSLKAGGDACASGQYPMDACVLRILYYLYAIRIEQTGANDAR